MQTVRVIATKAFEYLGRVFQRGEPVDMTPIDAAVAKRREQVSLDKAQGLSYQTREMVADPVATAEPVTVKKHHPQKPTRRRPKKDA